MGRSVAISREAVAVAYIDVSDLDYDDWNWFKQCQVEEVKALFPSLEVCDTWLANEVRAIAENKHCYIAISEYGGLAALQLISKEQHHLEYTYDTGRANLARAWCNAVKLKFVLHFTVYNKVGTMSNGESIYEVL